MENTRLITEELIKAFKEQNLNIDIKNINLFKQDILNTLNISMFESEEDQAVLDKLRGVQRLSRLGLNEKEITSLYNLGIHSAHNIAHLPEHTFIEEYNQYFSNTNRAKEIYTAAVAKKNKVVFDYVALHQHKDKYYNSSRFNNFGDVVDNASDANLLDSSTNLFPSYQDLFGGLDYCECSDCRSVLSPAAYLVDLKRMESDYIINNQTNFKFDDRRPDIKNIQLSCENTNTLIPKLEIVNEVLSNENSVINKSISIGSNVSPFTILSTSNVVLFKGKYYMLYYVVNSSSNKNEIRVVIFDDFSNIDFVQNSKSVSLILKYRNNNLDFDDLPTSVQIPMSLDVYNDELYVLLNFSDPTLDYYDYNSVLVLGKLYNNQIFALPIVSDKYLPDINNNCLKLISFGNTLYIGYSTCYGALDFDEWKDFEYMDNIQISPYANQLPEAKYISMETSKMSMYFLYIKETDNLAYINTNARYSSEESDFIKLNIKLSTNTPICKLKAHEDDIYLFYVGQDEFMYLAKLGIDSDKKVIIASLNKLFVTTNIYQGISSLPYFEAIEITKLLLSKTESNNVQYCHITKETKEQIFDRLSCTNPADQINYPLNLPFNLPVTEIRKYLSENNTSLNDIWEQIENVVSENKKVDLDKLGITEEQWNIVVDHEGISGTKTAVLYGILYKDDNSLINTLSNVDTFLKQTGISYKSLNDLLYQDLNVDDVKSDSYLGKFFINFGKSPVVINDKKLMLRTTKNGKLNFTSCTIEHFDKINRFIRLASLLQWSFAELDWALYSIANAQSSGNNEVTVLVINDSILTHLTWIKTIVDSKKITVNEACGFLYQIRQYGVSGHTMFDQIFYPFYKNKSDVIDKYLKIDDISDQENNKIKNMLSSCLKVSSNDFNEMVVALANSQTDKTKLQLTTINLARLYRLSLLPRLTGFSIDECKILFTLDSGTNGEVNLQSDLLRSLGNAKNPFQIINSLVKTAKRLKQNNFSIYQLQYWLTNYSDDNGIRNKIFDDKTLTNFISGLYKSEEPLFFTKDIFNKAIVSIENEFNNIPNIIVQDKGMSLSDEIFNQITEEEKKYVINSIITSIPSVEIIADLIFSYITATAQFPDRNQTLINTAATLIHQSLTSTSELQQQTYYHQLSTIHGLEDRFSRIFEKDLWADLKLLECIQEFGKITESKPILHDDSTTQQKSVVYKLRLIQKFADLIGNVGLSYTETDILDKNPEYFDIHVENAKFKLKFTIIENIKRFKSLQKEFQDYGNKLIDFCSASSDGTEILSDLMDEDASEIKKISEHLFGAIKDNHHKNINAVWNIKKCFDICNQLYVGAEDIIEITKIAGKTGVSTGYFANEAIVSERDICFSNIVKLGDKNYIAWSNSKNEIRCAVINLDNEEKLTEIYQLTIDDDTKTNGINPSMVAYKNNLYISYVTNVSELSNIVVGKVNIQVNIQNDILGYKVVPSTLVQENTGNTTIDIFCIGNSNPSLISHEDSGIYISYIKGTIDYSAYNDILVAKIELNTNKDVNPICSFVRVFDTYSTLHKNRFIGSTISQSKKIFVSYNDENNDTYIVFFDLLNEKWNENAIRSFKSDTAPKLVADKKSDDDGILSLLYLDTKGFNINSESISYKNLINNTDTNLYGTSKIMYRFKSRSNPMPYLDQSSFIFLPENISNHNLFYLKDSTVINNIDTLAKQKNLADRILSGLSKKYADNPEQLKKVKNSLLNDKRNALLPLTVHNLRSKGIEINNGRDLYEYFLIDVEADSIVETSRIVEANSALQLYIHRCRNNLEQYAEVKEQLDEWWPWMQNYRVWQANREVFLYPENYIEPSLRKDKTQLFKQLENDLQQSDLTDFNVDKALDSYVDNLAILADLDIVGGAAYDQIDEKGNYMMSYKHLMFIGTTKQEPTKYYYMTAMFNYYVPTFWSEWKEINCNLQPVKANTNGIVTPVFAFDKWYIFWVEEQQSDQDANHKSKYTANIYYSYLNNSDNWSAKNLCGTSDLGTTQIKDKGIAYDRVNVEYFTSVKTIYIGYAGEPSKFKIAKSNLGMGNNVVSRLYNTVPLKEVNFTFSTTFSLTFWFRITGMVIETGGKMILLKKDNSNGITIDSNYIITGFDQKALTVNGNTVKAPIGEWYHMCICNADSKSGSCSIYFNNQLCDGKYSFISSGIFTIENKLYSCTQDIIMFNSFFESKDVTELYNNSKNKLTAYIGRGSNLPYDGNTQVISIASQYDWSIVKKKGAQYLCYVSSSDSEKSCFTRLNSTAVTKLDSSLYLDGVNNLLTIDNQKSDEIPFSDISTESASINKKPSDKLDFTSGPMANYYWELFFYIPFLIARQLQNAGQFEQAKRWFEFIFNPAINKAKDSATTNDRYWRFLMLRSEYNEILKTELEQEWADEIKSDTSDKAQIAVYHNDPFDPHAIARLRPIAYQKSIVMHYINNLMNWGDVLYSKYTMETINDAMLTYVTAYDLLGKKPTDLGECALPNISDVKTILAKYQTQDYSEKNEFIILLENATNSTMLGVNNPINYITNSYFGLPSNEQFEQYWDIVEQRIYNIRHSLNIDGVYEKADLFAPAINPMELVSRVSSSNSLDQNFGDTNFAIPYYRFNVLIAKVKEITNIVIQFGQSLLSALEKKDAEALSRLYNSNQLNLLNLGVVSKQNELSGASSAIEGLQASLKNAQDRLNHYTNLINGRLSGLEIAQLSLESVAITTLGGAGVAKGMAGPAYLVPNIFGLADGGMSLGDNLAVAASAMEILSQVSSMSAGMIGIQASYERREQDWTLQQRLAQDDIDQITAQIESAKYQLSTAQNELKTLQKNIEQEQNVSAFFQSKFTNQELYQWLIGKLSALYFQSYNLALKLARQAEQAWQFEKSVEQKLIQGNYWNGSYKGLLAGESLLLDIHRMEQAYMDQDKRLLEIQKTISLAQLDPVALHNLRTTGSCTFNILEKDLAADYPGHYRRQIKNISITLPTLIGPYQNIHATLTQTSSRVLITQDKAGVEYLLSNTTTDIAPSSIRSNVMSNQQIAISQGVNDSGLISLNFNDERYLPFEGTGAVSSWTLDIPHGTNSIDFDNLTDVIVQMNYTAVAGDNSFKKIVKDALVLNSSKAYSMKDDFATDWNDFMTDPLEPLEFKISAIDLRKGLENYVVTGFTFLLYLTESGKSESSGFNEKNLCTISISGSNKDCKFTRDSDILVASVELEDASKSTIVTDVNFPITKSITDGSFINSSNISNMVVIAHYEAKIK